MNEPIDFKAERKVIKDTEQINMDLSDCDLQMAIHVLQEINVAHVHPDETLSLRVSRDNKPYVLRIFRRSETDKEVRNRLHQQREAAALRDKHEKAKEAREAKVKTAQEGRDRSSIPALRERLARLEAEYPEM